MKFICVFVETRRHDINLLVIVLPPFVIFPNSLCESSVNLKNQRHKYTNSE